VFDAIVSTIAGVSARETFFKFTDFFY